MCMRHFFLVPALDREASGESLFNFPLFDNATIEDLQTKVFDSEDTKNQQNAEEISSTTLYKWRKGISFPNIYKLIKLTIFLHRSVEDIFIFNYSYKEINKKIKSKHKTGTEIHSRIQTMYFEEEDLSIEELKEKYPYHFEEFEWNNTTGYNFAPFYSCDFSHYLYTDIDILRPVIDIDVIKQNFAYSLRLFEKTYGSINNYLTTLLDINHSATITNWKTEKTIPETELLLTVLRFLQIPFETLWVPAYICTNQEKISNTVLSSMKIFEEHFSEICNHDKYLSTYANYLKKMMERDKKNHPDHIYDFERYSNYNLEKLAELYLDDSGTKDNQKPWLFASLLHCDDERDYEKNYDPKNIPPDNYQEMIGSPCDDINRYLIYRIVNEDKIDRYYEIILKCFETFSSKPTLIEEHSE